MPSQTIGTAAVSVVPGNAGRKTITFNNRSAGGQILYLDIAAPGGMTATNAGYVLSPGAAISFMTEFDGADIQQEWSAISDVAGAILYTRETSIGK